MQNCECFAYPLVLVFVCSVAVFATGDLVVWAPGRHAYMCRGLVLLPAFLHEHLGYEIQEVTDDVQTPA